jgi:hypothetical protein
MLITTAAQPMFSEWESAIFTHPPPLLGAAAAA